MTACNIIVAGFDGGVTSAASLQHRLEHAWMAARPLGARALAAEDLPAEDLRNVDAVVLVVNETDSQKHVRPALSALEEAGTAVIALVEGPQKHRARFEFMGAMVADVSDDIQLVAARLNALIHRQVEVRRLRQEIDIAYRFHGGLRGEIARFHEELQLAAMVQREFLPRELPCLYGIEFAALWRPAHYVSGDIYDITRLDDDHVGVFIADAVGHGVPAALMTMVIARSLKTKTISKSGAHIIEPAEVMNQLNGALIRQRGQGTRFATGVYAVVNCRSRMMRLAGAGHPPPLLLRADGSTEKLETPGSLLGVFEDESYEQVDVELGVNDRLLLHSDGFEQAFPLADADAYESRIPNNRYRDEFETLARQLAPADMIRSIGQRLDDQQGSLHQADDLTLICMKTGALEASSAPPASDEAGAILPPLRLA